MFQMRRSNGMLSTDIPAINEPDSPIETLPRKRKRSVSIDTNPLSNVWNATPLGKEGQKIRILKLHGGTGANLEANLSIHNPKDSYEALSYTWGSEALVGTPGQQDPQLATGAEPPKIRIVRGDEIYEVPITSNLASALYQLRYKKKHKHRWLWIDALCINQKDHNEKNHQVPKMASIYNEAKNVCVWLGPENSEKAFAHIKRILNLDDFERLIEDEESAEDWNALLGLMKKRWFSRRWVVQEIALAREATVHCGEHFVKWKDFAKAVALFGARRHQISRLFQGSAAFDHQPNYLGDVTALAAHRLVQQSSNLFRKSDDGKIQEHLLSLETLVSILSPFEATMAHDIVYAVLSLAEDSGHRFSVKPAATPAPDAEEAVCEAVSPTINLSAKEKTILSTSVTAWRKTLQDTFPVDYEKTFFQVCKDFLNFTIRRSESLDIICRPWAPTNSGEDLPSWIPMLSGTAFRPDASMVHTRVKADSLVGLPTLGRRNYNAARKFPLNVNNKASFRIGEDSEDGKILEDGSLFVNGFVLDTINEMSHSAMQGNVPFEWMELAGWEDPSVPPPDAFWRTLIADRDADGSNPPLYYEIACQQAFAQRAALDDLNTHRWILAHRSMKASIEKVVVEYLQRLQSVVWKRRLVKTAIEEALGLAPDLAKEGDSICILTGCSVPVLLREKTNKITNKHYHELIGECYIHGMMDGEALRVKGNREIKTLTFELK
jgi:hypothetical protein